MHHKNAPLKLLCYLYATKQWRCPKCELKNKQFSPTRFFPDPSHFQVFQTTGWLLCKTSCSNNTLRTFGDLWRGIQLNLGEHRKQAGQKVTLSVLVAVHDVTQDSHCSPLLWLYIFRGQKRGLDLNDIYQIPKLFC